MCTSQPRPHLSHPGSGEFSPLRGACGCVCVGFHVSNVIQQARRGSSRSRSVSWMHSRDCCTHCQHSPAHFSHLSQACLGFPTQFVHKLWLPFGLLAKVTQRFVLIFVQLRSVLGHGWSLAAFSHHCNLKAKMERVADKFCNKVLRRWVFYIVQKNLHLLCTYVCEYWVPKHSATTNNILLSKWGNFWEVSTFCNLVG